MTAHHTIIWRSVALITTQKKTHGASGVADNIHGFSRPVADFAATAKLYQETHNRCKPEKGVL
ncbi:hypothetical protein LTSEADE_5233 [Salmonella enterica subsp. enterica serovar Adelaide str. A4-669]|uniref:Uncharacterized protein n=1 Tax=Salmonella enterica subsp. enterica serovar Adelaide str. A4-669 TaxID=913063 RepID=A0A6C8GH35_SALET|nr:hypothetical protein LTSEADE_5233 [Salmonella enterica subsp. enterica serovar Adelaide str. A4-669]